VAEFVQQQIGGVARGLDRVVGLRLDTLIALRTEHIEAHRPARAIAAHTRQDAHRGHLRELRVVQQVGLVGDIALLQQGDHTLARHRVQRAIAQSIRHEIHQAETQPAPVVRRVHFGGQNERECGGIFRVCCNRIAGGNACDIARICGQQIPERNKHQRYACEHA